MTRVELVPAKSPPHDAILTRLYPLYLHDISAFTDYYRLDETGGWEPDHLPDWLTLPLQHPFLVYVDGAPAGLSLVAEAPFEHMHRGGDYQLFEFWLGHHFRGRGIGRAAAHATFNRFPPGEWVVTEVPGNAGAIAFWRKVLGELTGGRFAEEHVPGDVIQRFRT